MSELLQNLLERVSTPANLLEAPAPDEAAIAKIIQAAVTAPDHAALRPWRFIIIQADAREQLGALFCKAAKIKNPDISSDELAAIQEKPLRSPLIIAVVASTKEHPKVPAQEQICSAAAATHNIQLAANALGYGSIWLTGPFASDPEVQKGLGLNDAEHIIAFVYLGTPSAAAAITKKKIQRRPNPADFIEVWEQ